MHFVINGNRNLLFVRCKVILNWTFMTAPFSELLNLLYELLGLFVGISPANSQYLSAGKLGARRLPLETQRHKRQPPSA